MTVTTTQRLSIHQGNGVTTVFPYDFIIPDNDVLSVQLQDHTTGAVLEVLTPSAYIVTGIGDPLGGNVTYNPVGGPITSAVDIVTIRTMPYTQDLEINNQGGFFPETLTGQLDFIVMQVQQLAEEQTRSLTVNPGQTPPDLQAINDAVAESAASAAAALLSEQNADVSEAAAAGSANLAQQWASRAEDDPVPGGGGLFSAFHYMKKAQAVLATITNTLAGWIHAATAKTPMIDADEFGYWDSVSGNLRKLTLANLVSSIFVATRTIANATFDGATFRLRNAATAFYLNWNVTALTASRTITLEDADIALRTPGPRLSAAIPSTSGTSFDFTGIPSWANRVTIIFDNVSSNGTAGFSVQIGPSAGIETTNYASAMGSIQGTNATIISNSLSTFIIANGSTAATSNYSGRAVLERVDGNTWVCNSQLVANAGGITYVQSGSKTTAAAMDRVRIAAGGNTFDAGKINIAVE